MCFKVPRLRLIKYQINCLCYSTTSKEQWDIVSSVCLQRKPIITKTLNDIETKYKTALNKFEFENSFKSDHEIRVVKDRLFTEELKKTDSLIDSDQVSSQTAQEFEDACEVELKKFKFGPRETPEDSNNDITSTNRSLANSLMLIVKQNFGKDFKWVLPQSIRKDGETMRQASERVLKEVYGMEVQARFLSNAPCGFYKFRYPKNANISSAVGMKIFFFKAQLVQGNIPQIAYPEHQWLTQEELKLLQKDYLRCIKLFLIDKE